MMESVSDMEEHITSICRSCYLHLRNIGTNRRYVDDVTAAQVIHAFVTSHLDNCNSFLSGLPQNIIPRLKKYKTLLLDSLQCVMFDTILFLI